LEKLENLGNTQPKRRRDHGQFAAMLRMRLDQISPKRKLFGLLLLRQRYKQPPEDCRFKDSLAMESEGDPLPLPH
jgi:hypothetical protein